MWLYHRASAQALANIDSILSYTHLSRLIKPDTSSDAGTWCVKQGNSVSTQGKAFFSVRVVKHWNRWPGEVVVPPFLEIIKT